MATTDMNAQMHIKDGNGNVNNIFPATKIANVEGLTAALNAKADTTTVNNQLSGKVDKETGKGLSTNDYTTAEKNKLSGIEAQANKTTVDSALSSSSENPVQNKVINTALGNKADNSTVATLAGRVTQTETDIATQTARIDAIASLPSGSTSGDAELMDIRVKADGSTATSAGAAVREQINELNDNLPRFSDLVQSGMEVVYTPGYQSIVLFDNKSITSGEKIAYDLTIDSTVGAIVTLCDSSGNSLGWFGKGSSGMHNGRFKGNYVIPANFAYARLDIGYSGMPSGQTCTFTINYIVKCDKLYAQNSKNLPLTNYGAVTFVTLNTTPEFLARRERMLTKDQVNVGDVIAYSFTVNGGAGFLALYDETFENQLGVYGRLSSNDSDGVYKGTFVVPNNFAYAVVLSNTIEVDFRINYLVNDNEYIRDVVDESVTAFTYDNDITSILAKGGHIRLANKEYTCGSVTLPSNTVVEGIGLSTNITFTGSGKMLTLSDGCILKRITLTGNRNAETDDIGIEINGARLIKLDDINVNLFSRSAVRISNLGMNAVLNNVKISNSTFARNEIGIEFAVRGEFSQVVNCGFANNTIGCLNGGGNNIFANCSFNSNDVGFKVVGGSSYPNSGHGSATGCQFNHNTTTAIEVDNNNVGFDFTGCQAFYGDIIITDSEGVMITNTQIGSNPHITVSGGRYNLFKDILSHSSAPEVKKLNGSIADFVNVKTYDGVDVPVLTA